MNNLKLSEVWIYPVKSLWGIKVKAAKVMEKGLQFDRRFMLVNDEGLFMTQRIYPKMALFKLCFEAQEFTIRFQQDKLTLPAIPVVKPEQKKVRVWDDTLWANEVDGEYSKWFSNHLGINCSLVFFPEENPRPVNPKYKVNNEHVSLADAYPFLIIGQSSLDDLNSRLAVPLPMNRFRPNLVFTGGEPYEEDHWRNFTIGSNRFVGVKPCDRCVMTTVNQDTAQKGAEPLKTLATYRKRDNKIYFGQNLVGLDTGTIQVGDVITLQ